MPVLIWDAGKTRRMMRSMLKKECVCENWGNSCCWRMVFFKLSRVKNSIFYVQKKQWDKMCIQKTSKIYSPNDPCTCNWAV